ncbi:MAG: porin [Gammaproteobacteria bacterium]|nr:porin [Gammaproteobacteria bacterium]
MRNTKTLLSVAVATALGAAAVPASAAAPIVYGDLAVALVSNGAYASTGTGSKGSLTMYDNVSLLGVKGDVGTIDGIKYFYDFNWLLNITTNHATGSAGTHLSMVGMEGGFGTVSLGKRDVGLFSQMVDGGTYLTNYYYTPGMSSFQVSDAVKYVSKSMGGFQIGAQAFDIGKDNTSGKSTNNYTVAATYLTGDLTLGAGYTDYSKYADGSSTKYGFSTDLNQFIDSQNTWSGIVLKSTAGISAAYKMGKFGVVGAYDMRKPADKSGQVTNTINTLMLTGSYAMTDKITFVADYSDTSQSDGAVPDTGKKGNIITAMVSYAPSSAILYSLELQNSDKNANKKGITGSSAYGLGGTPSKASTGIALGVTYNF